MSDSGILRRMENPDSGILSRSMLAFDPEGGVDLSTVRAGAVLEVQTRNTAYTVIPQGSGETLIWGHPEYCPEPIRLNGLGSSYLNGVFREGYLGLGMRLSFRIAGRHITTSRILKIQAKPRN